MDPSLVAFLGLVLLLVTLALGVHIGIALTISGLVGMSLISGFYPALKTATGALYHKVSNPTLVTLPLFILMGVLAGSGGISDQIYETLNKWLGKVRAGLGISTIFGCAAFGTVCGSSLVTAAVFAKTAAPQMRRQGYDKTLSYSICATAGTIGMLIPPSILAVVYGMLSGLSIGKVLMAGVAPGILLTIGFSLVVFLISIINPAKVGPPLHSISWKERLRSIKNFWTIAVVGSCIFGGIYGGVFTPTEASAFAAFALIVIHAILRLPKLGLDGFSKELLSALRETSITSGMIFLVMGGATVFSQFVVLCGLAGKLSRFFSAAGLDMHTTVALLCFFILILGCFLDGISILSITIPVFNPIVAAAGADLVWYATLAILATEIGLVTPPVGLNVYATKGVAETDVRLEDIFRGIIPFFMCEVIVLVILYIFPWVATFLPSFVD
ncbi:MAG: TRAP transporter large permease [Candidatus Methanomethylicaceae archaeon]